MVRASAVVTAFAGALLLAIGCGGEPQQEAAVAEADSTDIKLIQDMFTEVVTRWHYGDKVALYDSEFEYVQAKHTVDEYLEFDQIKYLEADTLVAFKVRHVTLFDRDSAHVVADAVFVGPSGDTSYFTDQDVYHVYYHRGRWIHPSAGVIDKQIEYEELRRVADSAAEAEAELEDF